MLSRFVVASAIVLGAGLSAAPVAAADGVERARPAHRSAPRPAPRARTQRPPPSDVAPSSAIAPPAAVERERVTLSDGFFLGSLTGGVGYANGAGEYPVGATERFGGGFAPGAPQPRFSGLAGRRS